MHLDKRAIKLFLQKDEAASAYVYRKTCKLVKYVAFDVLHNDDDAEDAMMETYLKVMESGMSFSNAKTFLNYLCSTANHIAINMAKKSERIDYLEDEDSLGSNEVSTFASPLLSQAKTVLGNKDYELLVYHICLGLSFPQIASMQGGTASSCRGRYFRGLKKLKASIGKENLG